jgi:phosphopantetheinyl transferase (holo-ACP synthase)
VGNDLVDLKAAAAESNWKRKGYLDKVFTAAEQHLINTSETPDVLVWLLWSMKEAAYKVHSRKTGIRSFAPTALACTGLELQDRTATGTVSFDQEVYYTQTEINESYIHSVAAVSPDLLPLIKQEIYDYTPGQSNYRARNPACVSHHGRYLALIF